MINTNESVAHRFWMAVVLLLVLSACESQQVPDQLISYWETDDKRYKNCVMEFTECLIFLGDSEGQVKTYFIKTLSTAFEGSNQILTIEYKDIEGNSFTGEWVYSPDNGGSLWFRNQPDVVWKRQQWLWL